MRPRVVIIGGGFGGLKAAQRLKRAPVDITLVDRANHHLFQPLLYQVATATLAPSDIATPIRWLLRKQKNAEVLMAAATRVDVAQRVVELDHGADLPYDYLVMATGARHSYFGHPEWEAIAPGLKNLRDAVAIRNRFLASLEAAERTDDLPERQAFMTFVIVGGGPTGCELAGILGPVSHVAFRKDFHRIDTRDVKVILLEGSNRILPGFPDSLAEHAVNDLRKLGVDVRLGAKVTRVEPGAVEVNNDERIATRTIFWAAGNAASPLARTLGVPLDSAGRVIAERDLSVPGHPEIFVVGDVAAVNREDGTLVPGVAPAAMQTGWHAAGNILASLAGRPRKPFHYVNKGDLATLGRHRAIANFGFIRFTGVIAWWLWLFVHILYLAGFRNRLSVLVEWAYAYLTYQRGSRIITVFADEAPEVEPPASVRRTQREYAASR
jgi:NADH:quinone reductase (non-electrogenic)